MQDDKRRIEAMACKLILAYLQDDPLDCEHLVYSVGDEADMPDEYFRLANYTAANAAQFWRQTYPELGRKLLLERLNELTAVVA